MGLPRSLLNRHTGIFLLALGIRLFYVHQVADSPFFDHPLRDPGRYVSDALRVVGGDILIGDRVFFHSGVLYTYFLALTFLVFGTSFVAVYVIQAVVGAANCVLLGLIGERVFSRPVGILAGVLAALYAPFVFFDAMPIEILFVLLFNGMGLLAFLRYRDRTSGAAPSGAADGASPGGVLGLLFVVGACLGLSALGKGNMLLFVVPVAAYLIAQNRRAPAVALARTIVFVGGVLLVVLPVTVRNLVVADDLVLTTVNGGINFYIGNNPEAQGGYFVSGELAQDPDLYTSMWNVARARSGQDLTASEASRYWLDEGLRYARENPGTTLRSLLHKFRLVFNHIEIPNYLSFDYYKATWGPMLRLLLTFGLLAPFAILGIVQSLRRQRSQATPLLWFVGIYIVSILPFFVTARYRLPAVAGLVVFAAYGLVDLVGSIRRRSLSGLAVAIVILAGATLFVHHDSGIVHDDRFLSARFLEALAHLEKGEYATAESGFDDVVRSGRLVESDSYVLVPAYVDLTFVQLQQGKHAEILQSVERAQAEGLESATLHVHAAKAHEALDQTLLAIAAYERALALDPDHADALNEFGKLLARVGEIERAMACFRKAAELRPEDPEPHLNMGVLLQSQDRDATYRHFKRFLELGGRSESVSTWIRTYERSP